MNIIATVVLLLISLATFLVSPPKYKIGLTIAVIYSIITIAGIIKQKYEQKYYTLVDSYALSEKHIQSHQNAHAEMLANT